MGVDEGKKSLMPAESKRRVQISDHVSVCYVNSRRCISKEEKFALWYNRKEMKAFHVDVAKTVSAIRQHHGGTKQKRKQPMKWRSVVGSTNTGGECGSHDANNNQNDSSNSTLDTSNTSSSSSSSSSSQASAQPDTTTNNKSLNLQESFYIIASPPSPRRVLPKVRFFQRRRRGSADVEMASANKQQEMSYETTLRGLEDLKSDESVEGRLAAIEIVVSSVLQEQHQQRRGVSPQQKNNSTSTNLDHQKIAHISGLYSRVSVQKARILAESDEVSMRNYFVTSSLTRGFDSLAMTSCRRSSTVAIDGSDHEYDDDDDGIPPPPSFPRRSTTTDMRASSPDTISRKKFLLPSQNNRHLQSTDNQQIHDEEEHQRRVIEMTDMLTTELFLLKNHQNNFDNNTPQSLMGRNRYQHIPPQQQDKQDTKESSEKSQVAPMFLPSLDLTDDDALRPLITSPMA